jgi:diamine N-acetyltransferase
VTGPRASAIEARPVERSHVHPLIALATRPDQAGLVSPNVVTLAQAPYETGALVLGLWRAAEAVGLMAMVENRAHRHLAAGEDVEAAFLWRLMVAEPHQGRGVGRAAIEAALATARRWGCPQLFTSVVDGRPDAALGFYRRLGFAPTGRTIEGEIELMRSV